MSRTADASLGDFVQIATCGTPTEAHLLKGVLLSVGLSPHVADANTVQANTWLTEAVGGVRVLVPASQLEEARKALAEFNAGAYRLEGEEAPPVAYRDQASPVFSPDRAVLLSFLLTPAFGAAIQLANARTLGLERRAGHWTWLVLLAVASALGVAFMQAVSPGPWVAFRASLGLSFITIAWYFVAGQEQTRMLISTYGPRYRKKSPAKPAIAVALVLLVLGWGLSEYL